MPPEPHFPGSVPVAPSNGGESIGEGIIDFSLFSDMPSITSSDTEPRLTVPLLPDKESTPIDASLNDPEDKEHNLPINGNIIDNIADVEDLAMFLFMRLSNLIISLILIIVALGTLIRVGSFHKLILSVYVILGSFLILVFELQLKPWRELFEIELGFMYSPFVRLAYYTLMCMISWSLGNSYSKSASTALGIIAIFNTYLMVTHPDYKKTQKQIAENEDKRIVRSLTVKDDPV